jgi:hypothetical protein
MGFSIQSITDAGHAAIQAALDGGYPLIFTSIKTGNGNYTEGEDVTGMTALKSLKNTYVIGSKETDADGVTLGAVLVNYDGEEIIVATSYRINEIGLFCTVNDTEYLYAVAAVPDNGGREMPGYDATNLTQIVQRWFVAYTNDLNIQVDMAGAFALATDLSEEIEDRRQSDFEILYDLGNKTTTIEEDNGDKLITEVDSDREVTTVTRITNTSPTVKTITTTITPDDGDYYWTKVEVITTTISGKTITKTTTKSPKA